MRTLYHTQTKKKKGGISKKVKKNKRGGACLEFEFDGDGAGLRWHFA